MSPALQSRFLTTGLPGKFQQSLFKDKMREGTPRLAYVQFSGSWGGGGVTGLPRWLRGKESTCQHSRCGLDPWVEKIP